MIEPDDKHRCNISTLTREEALIYMWFLQLEIAQRMNDIREIHSIQEQLIGKHKIEKHELYR